MAVADHDVTNRRLFSLLFLDRLFISRIHFHQNKADLIKYKNIVLSTLLVMHYETLSVSFFCVMIMLFLFTRIT